MENIKIDGRLLTAEEFVRAGARFADVGTDHAYLPIYLLKKGLIERAVASDVNRGPLLRADENIKKYGCEDKISTLLCDGLSGLSEFDPTDIAIFGMGGELIVRIIDEAPWVRQEGKRLILQPMTHPEKVREYLAERGFFTVGETLSLDRGKIYQTICAQYDGAPRSLDKITLLLGEMNIQKRGELFYQLVQNAAEQAKRRIKGKKSGGEDVRDEEELLSALTRLMEEKQ